MVAYGAVSGVAFLLYWRDRRQSPPAAWRGTRGRTNTAKAGPPPTITPTNPSHRCHCARHGNARSREYAPKPSTTWT
ncbi:hypothetical protein B1218_39335, partial [Pseudomonas ogarae]